MEEFTQEISARNLGEKRAKLSYVIREVTILGTTYSCEDGTTTPEDLWELIQSDDYPFHITILIEDGGIIEAGTGTSNVTISLTWPFDQNNDELDTHFGELAYEYHGENPDESSISLKIELKATQIE